MHQNSLENKVQQVITQKSKLGSADDKKIVINDVLEALGTPPKLYEVTACNVFEDKWRVNVWIKQWSENEDVVCQSYSMPHSFFCTVQDNWIVDSNPKIEKLY